MVFGCDGAWGFLGSRLRGNDGGSCMVALVVEAAPEQFPGGGYAVMGLEALVVSESVHDFGV